MDTTLLRYLIAGIFVAFIAYLVLADLWKRLPRFRPKASRPPGFRRDAAIRTQQLSRTSWKSGVRR